MSYKEFLFGLILILLVVVLTGIISYQAPPPEVAVETQTDVPIDILPTPVYNMSVPLTVEQQQFVQEVCRDTIYTPDLLYAVMSVESKFNVDAYSVTQDIGIMQINSTYYRFYIDCNPKRYIDYNANTETYYSFKTNVITGINALEYWQAIYSTTDYREILAHYNGGNSPNYNYADKVLKEMLGI